MSEKNSNSNHLIDDSGVYQDVKQTQSMIFIFFCRILTIALIGLGAVALIMGNM